MLEEVVLGDLMREYGMTLEQVWNTGYYTAWRLWFVLDELKARDLTHFTKALFAVQSTEDYIRSYEEWLKGRQPRLSEATSPIKLTKEERERIERLFNDG